MSKFNKEIVENLIRYMVRKLESDKLSDSKKQKDLAAERLLGLKILCEKADMSETLERIQDGRML